MRDDLGLDCPFGAFTCDAGPPPGVGLGVKAVGLGGEADALLVIGAFAACP
jgi:hypothetical protein